MVGWNWERHCTWIVWLCPAKVKQSACPHFFYHYQKVLINTDKKLTSPIDDPLARSDTKPWEMWGTTHGADDDNHDFLFIIKFSSWFLWQFSLLVIILHMYFLERKEYVLSGECIRSPPPCLDLLIARIGITFGRVLPLWSFSAWRWSWWSNDNHHPIFFVYPSDHPPHEDDHGVQIIIFF